MEKAAVLICKSCGEHSEDKSEGLSLYNQVVELSTSEDLEVHAMGCLWTCDRACSATFVCPDKYTYHFVDLSLENSQDLIDFSELYNNSKNGYILPAKVPENLQNKLLVRVPVVPNSKST